MSALEGLQAVQDQLEAARVVARAASAERRRAPRVHEQARAALRSFYAEQENGAAPDPERERELTARVVRLGAEIVSVPLGNGMNDVRHLAADERFREAELAVEDLERELSIFRSANAEAIAAELAGRARKLADRYRPVAAQVARLEREYSEVIADWRQMLEPLGLTVADLPESPAQNSRFTTVMPPMPVPLMQLTEMTPPVRGAVEAKERELLVRRRDRQAAIDLAEEARAADGEPPEATS